MCERLYRYHKLFIGIIHTIYVLSFFFFIWTLHSYDTREISTWFRWNCLFNEMDFPSPFTYLVKTNYFFPYVYLSLHTPLSLTMWVHSLISVGQKQFCSKMWGILSLFFVCVIWWYAYAFRCFSWLACRIVLWHRYNAVWITKPENSVKIEKRNWTKQKMCHCTHTYAFNCQIRCIINIPEYNCMRYAL